MAINIILDKAEVQSVIDSLPATIFKAQRSAISTTTTWAKKELQNRMITKTGIPARVFRRFRVKSRRDREKGVVWIGINDVKAAYVGKMSQDIAGSFAGEYFFRGGFVAKMKSGHVGIFKRLGKSRMPLSERFVKLDVGMEVAESVAVEAQIELRNRFATKVRELNPNID